MKATNIKKITARQILDSRGIPTLETTVILTCGAVGKAKVPSGASTGKFEAHEKRDGNTEYFGKSVYKACNSVNTEINALLKDKDAEYQYNIDKIMREADGTENKSNFGANAILSVSLAVAKAAASAYDLPLYRYLGGRNARVLPIPMLNIINGGAHADNKLDIQEFMICPVGAHTFREAMRMAVEVYGNLKEILIEDDYGTSVGDEGGFAPQFENAEQALQYILRAIEFAGYQPGKEISIALDIAASEWYQNGKYTLPKSNLQYDKHSLIQYYETLFHNYPIISVEDPLYEEDFDGFSALSRQFIDLKIVGDDLFVTNPNRLQIGIDKKSATSILIKPNQIGTLSETLDAIEMAKHAGMQVVLSHRSGDTCDTSISDIAVATGSQWIKAGAPARAERVEKYNRLLEIEEDLQEFAIFKKRGSC